MTQRRYTDEEMRAIFAAASDEEPSDEQSSGEWASDGGALESGMRSQPQPEGLTLDELVEIGAEVGLSNRAITEAAQHLDAGSATHTAVAAASTTTGFGGLPARLDATRRLPLTVAASGQLTGPLSDDKWEELVARLRATFNATGTVQQVGRLRTWRNGNLQVHVEPAGGATSGGGASDGGWQVRLFTRSGQFSQTGLVGSMSGIGGGLLALIGQPAGGIFLARAGLATLAFSVVGSRSWARQREAQFAEIVAYVQRLTGD